MRRPHARPGPSAFGRRARTTQSPPLHAGRAAGPAAAMSGTGDGTRIAAARAKLPGASGTAPGVTHATPAMRIRKWPPPAGPAADPEGATRRRAAGTPAAAAPARRRGAGATGRGATRRSGPSAHPARGGRSGRRRGTRRPKEPSLPSARRQPTSRKPAEERQKKPVRPAAPEHLASLEPGRTRAAATSRGTMWWPRQERRWRASTRPSKQRAEEAALPRLDLGGRGTQGGSHASAGMLARTLAPWLVSLLGGFWPPEGDP